MYNRKSLGIGECQRCGKDIILRSIQHKYCSKCSSIVNKEKTKERMKTIRSSGNSGSPLDKLKEACIKVWKQYKDDDYRKEKIDRVNLIQLEEDAYILINMFDIHNQMKLFKLLDEETQKRYVNLFIHI